MARIRTIKPDFFRHGALFDAEQESGLPLRLAFAGLWTAADRDGRFRWRPRELKLDVLPHDAIDFSRVLDALATRGFVVKYACDGELFGFIPSWHQHQAINHRETASVLPVPTPASIESATSTRAPRVDDASATSEGHARGEGKGREGKESAQDADASCAAAPPLQLVPSIPAPPASVVSLILVDGTHYGITQQQVDSWGQAFPAVDVLAFLRRMAAWCDANAQKRKTRRGIERAIVGWLGREQDRGPTRGADQPPSSTRPGGPKRAAL